MLGWTSHVMLPGRRTWSTFLRRSVLDGSLADPISGAQPESAWGARYMVVVM